MNKCVLITGATSGIGEATARVFAEEKYNVIITGRRSERLKALKAELEREFGIRVHILCFDIRDRSSCEAAVETLSEEFKEIDVLVNNAGLALGRDLFHECDTNDWNIMIDTNIKGLLYISRVVANMMIRQGRGHIVNIGSIAGMEPYQGGNVYCASKHAVHGLTECMRIDLLGHGIRVTEICPGMVETEFSVVRFKGNQQKADEVYAGLEPLHGEDIAEAIIWAVSLPEHVNINQITITPTAQANSLYKVTKQ
ncbi:MAG: SDR family NAD(P)-dependent oxidoreductase [Tidjanibacter sp.]|nr:SDR family NAD(P)-dependent oxidoreductase [Tidjanibacter sp.]